MNRRTNLKTFLLISAFLPAMAGLAQGRTITVGPGPGDDFNTIQAAIDDSNDGDTIIVYPGRYTENINFLGKNIILSSTNPTNPSMVASTVIDGGLRGSVVTFAGSESLACVLSGFTVTNGCGTGIGYTYGGGIYGNGTLATIQYNIVSGNRAVSPMWPCSGYGGGFYNCDGTIQYNTISGNGALCNEGGAGGGGLYDCDGSIQNNVISGNWASGFTGGQGDVEGGGLSHCNGIIQNNTIIGNLAEYGGGLSHCNGTIRNCIIWENRADDGMQLYASSTPSYSCIEDWLGGGDGNIDLYPLFVDSGYWDVCGLPFPHYPCWVETGDYHLRSLAGRWDPDGQTWAFDFETSPCIDGGNPGCPLADEPNDVNNIRINMGAYGGTDEASKTPANWRNIADLTNDWTVDFNDLKVFVDYWLETGRCIPSDLNRSRTVDFNDFAIFSGQWQEKGPGPGITYEVDECIPVEPGLFAVEQTGQTRFSVWVEGNYIHFEDLITANCCADKIELQMTVEDNLITIHEIEHIIGIPCPCICDYPVTATLGPFEEGNYLVEVIDVNGYSIGVVEVTIGEPIWPSITYQIEDCDPAASGLFAAEEADQTRFTAVVEGRYIHFEDMMTANCCPDELELQMVVVDDVITIYETEYTPGGCFCICDYPITATLGPFEPGTYILEVYEDYGGFIGRTTVTIGPTEK